MTLQDIYLWLDRMAPFDTQESFDNSGMLLGHPSQEVRRVFFTLDVTPAALDEADDFGADLIISHHPLIFHPLTHLREDDSQARILCRMIRRSMGLICAHTNLDRAPGGINDVLLETCGLQLTYASGYVRAGRLRVPMPVNTLRTYLEKKLGAPVRIMGNGTEAPVTTIALSSGAGSEFWPQALECGAQVFLSGEIRHHHALEMNRQGIIAAEAGHDATEKPVNSQSNVHSVKRG